MADSAATAAEDIPEGARRERLRGYLVGDLSFGEILDHSLYLARDNFKIIALSVLVFDVPVRLVIIGLNIWLGLAYPQIVDMASPQPVDPVTFGTPFSLLIGIGFFGSFLLLVIAVPLTNGAVIYGISMSYLGEPKTFGECARVALRRWGAMALGNLIYTVLVAIGTLFCIIPGVILALYWIIFQPVIILENRGPAQGLSRAGELMRGFMIIAFVLYLCVSFLHMPFQGIVAVIPNMMVQSVLANLLGPFVSILFAVVTTVLYFTSRCRKEHMDLDLAAARVDTIPAAEGAAL